MLPSLLGDALSINSSKGDIPISLTIQYGNLREQIVLERSTDVHVLECLRERARQLILKCGDRSDGEVHLFKHDYLSPQMLQQLSCVSQLDNGSVVEVIVVDRNEKPTKPHMLEVNTYMAPTFCDYCGEILVGLIKQGLQCQRCRCNFHKKCAFAPRNNCAKDTSSLAPAHMLPTTALPSSSGLNDNLSSHPNFALPHTLAVHNYKTLTVCKVCDKMLFGLMKQGLRCRDCKVNVHKKCAHLLPQNCQLSESSITPSFDQMQVQEAEQPRPNDEIDSQSTSEMDAMIPLSRLPGQAWQRANAKTSHEGWVIHFVLNEPERRLRHYWILNNNIISMFNEYNEGIGVNPHRCYRQIPLAEILSVTAYNGEPIDSKYPAHVFEIRTIHNVIFCVGENLDSLSAPPSKLPRGPPRGASSAYAWLQVLAVALQPPPTRADPSNAEPALQFTELYQVLSDKTLGAGQFGTVYSGVHRQSGREVAVKVISKERFSKKQNNGQDTLRAEVAILQTISHPGIVRLESMFETKDKIFVVMEKMNGDMLEMILSQAAGKLDERITKFLIMQILSALRYLHTKGIAHCDLKPENVLLSDLATNFPMTKLCDFGYARFIGESQFRKTIVGTPAYLPPEVLQKRGYNKSLDMWSVGVIIYVTLSGTFPFNDGEEVSEQIQNAAFMFPADPWSTISPSAINLIQRLLRVQIEERMNIEECCAHEWLQGAQLYLDLRALELRLGAERYLTSEHDDLQYAEYLKQVMLSPGAAL